MARDYKKFGKVALGGYILLIAIIVLYALSTNDCAGQADCGKNHLGEGKIQHVWNRPVTNSLYGIYQVGDNGGGVRYSRYFTKNLGAYGSVSRGKYWLVGFTKTVHNKIATGVEFITLTEDIARNFLYAGVCYHNFQNFHVPSWDDAAKYSKLHTWSFEIGTGIVVKYGFSLEFGYDFMRNESNVGLGWSF